MFSLSARWQRRLKPLAVEPVQVGQVRGQQEPAQVGPARVQERQLAASARAQERQLAALRSSRGRAKALLLPIRTPKQPQSITGLPLSNPTEIQAQRNRGAGTAPNGQPIGSPGSGLGSRERLIITGLPPSHPAEIQAQRNRGAGTAPNGQPIGSSGSGLGSSQQPINSRLLIPLGH